MLCGEFLVQSDSVVRVICEIARKEKGDPPDPARFSNVTDWDLSFIAHETPCARDEVRYRDALVEIPCQGELIGLLEEEDDPDDDPRAHLRVVR